MKLTDNDRALLDILTDTTKREQHGEILATLGGNRLVRRVEDQGWTGDAKQMLDPDDVDSLNHAIALLTETCSAMANQDDGENIYGNSIQRLLNSAASLAGLIAHHRLAECGDDVMHEAIGEMIAHGLASEDEEARTAATRAILSAIGIDPAEYDVQIQITDDDDMSENPALRQMLENMNEGTNHA